MGLAGACGFAHPCRGNLESEQDGERFLRVCRGNLKVDSKGAYNFAANQRNLRGFLHYGLGGACFGDGNTLKKQVPSRPSTFSHSRPV